jgi:hypothetical protein
MWAGADARKCIPLTDVERDQKLVGRGAWDVTERLFPDRFVEVQYTETSAEQSVTPSFPKIENPTIALCVPCDITDAYACGGIPGRCYKSEGSLQGCCVQ